MKNTLKLLAATITALTLTVGSVKANSKKMDTTDFVVNGKIIKTNKQQDSRCTIELFNENKVIQTQSIKMNRSFEFKLKKNVWYTIRVTKEGYTPLLISFNTELDTNQEVINNLFRFETELIELAEAKKMNQDLIDFPVGIVSYNKATKCFDARDVYTNNYIAKLNTVDLIPGDIVIEYTSRKNVDRDMC
jgi:hypothetical protein